MADELTINPTEARVLGVLIEKDLTTPDQYPLTLNSITLGANQKSNRDPVMNLLEGEAHHALSMLLIKGYVGSVHPMGSRVEKFRHNTEAVLKLGVPEIAVMAELLLRGPQQPGELRSRVSRMAEIATQPALMELLRPLLERGLVKRIEPPPGSRAELYAQTIAPTAHATDLRSTAMTRAVAATSEIRTIPSAAPSLPALAPVLVNLEPHEARISELESQVARLRRQLDHLAWKLGEKLEA